MVKKITLLFLALAVPGLIFIFLKQCGKNVFAIPMYYQNNVDSLNTACGTRYAQPYQVPDSVLEKIGWRGKQATLLVFDSAMWITPELDSTELQIVRIEMAVAKANNWSSCVFMLRPSTNVVLIDKERRLRGYYTMGSREEADRFSVELEILLKKY